MPKYFEEESKEMKKETMIKTLQSPISRADIKLKDNRIIFFGHNIHMIQYESRYFTCIGSSQFFNEQIKYSNVNSIEVFA